MAHLSPLIVDLALILTVAGVTTLLFKKIKQPVVLGYVIAGVLVGPHFNLVPTVVDDEAIRIWSEIGVIFLLFSLGLEFSFKKLVKVGGSATITAITGIVLMNGIGMLTGYLMGWSYMDCIYLGAILSISSTTIIMRAFDELGVRTKKFAQLVFGVLIVQDLVAILLLVLLTTFSVERQFVGMDLAIQVLKLIFFLTLWFLAGIFFIPTVLNAVKKHLNNESLLIIALALCLSMVLLAVQAGFSAPLGAFIMGSILAETTYAERIEDLLKPVKYLFAAVFFISVGMLIDPNIIQQYTSTIVIISAVIIVGMTITFTLGALLSGQSLKHSIQAGMSLAQIGEFSFIIAALGVSLNVTNAIVYPIAVAASAVTTFTTPFMIKSSSAVFSWVERRLPSKWVRNINSYSSGSQQLSSYSEWRELLNAYLINAAINSVLIIAVMLLSREYVHPFIDQLIERDITASVVTIAITLVAMIPFVWALSVRRVEKDAYSKLWLNRRLNRAPLIVIEVIRILISAILIGAMLNFYFPVSVAFVIAVLLVAVALVLFNNRLQQFYDRIHYQFMTNLNERERMKKIKNEITPWDAHLAVFTVDAESKLAGEKLEDLRLRERFGANIALVERGKISIVAPSRDIRLFPGDKLSVIGTDDQLGKLKELFENEVFKPVGPEIHDDQIVLQNVVISKTSPLYGESVRSSRIREIAKALIVGYERNGQRVLNPDSTVNFQEGDIVWIVGVKRDVNSFLAEIHPKDTTAVVGG